MLRAIRRARRAVKLAFVFHDITNGSYGLSGLNKGGTADGEKSLHMTDCFDDLHVEVGA
jgi:hypothetical protein